MKDIKEVARSKKGQFASVTYESPAKVRKAHEGMGITKRTKVLNARFGVRYDAMKAVQESKGAENTKEAQDMNQGLKGMEWVEYPLIIKGIKSGKEMLRMECSKNTVFQTEYFMDGKAVSKEEIESMLLKQSRSGEPTVVNIPIDNITEIK